LPAWVIAQDVSGESIEEIASSVVMIETLRGRRAIAGGTGTIISGNGIIYTNQHVIEDGDDYAIYMLDGDIGEQPELRYYASLLYVSDRLDFAVLQIDRDERRNPINAETENLPYLPANKQDQVSVGDSVRVFGYPGIGEGYMIITSGEIVSVQNGTIGGERLPVWYRTDAEISGGNSGGLAVNEMGEFIGLPTWVVSEERTAGRLGGILPLQAILRDINANFDPDTPQQAQPPAGSGNTLTVVNDSLTAICSAYISPTTARVWGGDQLENNQIGAGASFSWDFTTGSYDLLLVGCDGRTLEDFRNITVEGGTIFTYTPGGSTFVTGDAPPDADVNGLVTLGLQNNGIVNICYVYISESNDLTWGEDQLGPSEIIRAGTTRTWDLSPGRYDVLLEDCNREELDDVRNIDLTTDSYTLTYP